MRGVENLNEAVALSDGLYAEDGISDCCANGAKMPLPHFFVIMRAENRKVME
jgi:hypothetical protein